MNKTKFVLIKTILIFIVAYFVLTYYNKSEAQIHHLTPMFHNNQEREYIPEVKPSRSGTQWRCETWHKNTEFGWGESDSFEVAFSTSIKHCSDTFGKDKCGLPICRYKSNYKIYKT